MYEYKNEREKLFTDEGQRKLLDVRDNVKRLLAEAGAVSMLKAMAGVLGSTWESMACVDRLVELGEIVEVTQSDIRGQDRIFVER